MPANKLPIDSVFSAWVHAVRVPKVDLSVDLQIPSGAKICAPFSSQHRFGQRLCLRLTELDVASCSATLSPQPQPLLARVPRRLSDYVSPCFLASNLVEMHPGNSIRLPSFFPSQSIVIFLAYLANLLLIQFSRAALVSVSEVEKHCV